MEKIKDPNTALLLNFHDGCFIFYHLSNGHLECSSLALIFIKHPHSLQVHVGLNSDGHSLQMLSLSNAFSLSTIILILSKNLLGRLQNLIDLVRQSL